MAIRIICVIVLCFSLNATELLAQNLLLIPDSTEDRVSAFDPFDGSLVNLDFIPNNGLMSTPINAIASGRGTIFVSDQIADAVFEYNFDGSFVGTVLDNSNGLDNVRGIAMFGNELYVTVASGSLAGTVQRYDLMGGQATFASGVDPFDIYFRANDALVSNIADENIESYAFDGTYNGPFHDSDGVNGIDFPEQIHEALNGDVLVAGFSPPAGVYRYDSMGNQINYFDVGGARGVYELGNGNLLFTTGSGVFSLDQATGATVQIATGSYRFIENVSTIPEPGCAAILIIAGLWMGQRRRRSA